MSIPMTCTLPQYSARKVWAVQSYGILSWSLLLWTIKHQWVSPPMGMGKGQALHADSLLGACWLLGEPKGTPCVPGHAPWQRCASERAPEGGCATPFQPYPAEQRQRRVSPRVVNNSATSRAQRSVPPIVLKPFSASGELHSICADSICSRTEMTAS